jgi:glycosyltransferase involved in cell wall biosynthesis
MKRRFLWISEHASPLALLGGADAGGQNVYVDQVARHLGAVGHRVDILTRRDRADLPRTVALAEGVRVIHVPAGPPEPVRKGELLPYIHEFTQFALRYLGRRGASYDIIHTNFFMSALVAAELKRATGTPFVVTFQALGRVRRLHQGGADSFPIERLAIEDHAVATADRIIAECPQDELDLSRMYGADRGRIAVIPCGFDSSEFWPIDRSQARRTLGLPQDEPTVLQLGRIVPRKGIDNVIRGVARLKGAHGLSARLLVVGGESREPDPAREPEIGRLMAIAREEGVSEAVTFVGSRTRAELRDYYGAADIFVSTPWYEPFGITPVEAMACGTPVIGSAVGGIRTTVVDGVTGYLVPPNDPEGLAVRLAELLRHPARRRRFGRRAIRRASIFYTWSRVAQSIAGVYEDVLERRPVSASSHVVEFQLPRVVFNPCEVAAAGGAGVEDNPWQPAGV